MKAAGTDFWTDKTAARVRQKEWLAYQDGDAEAVMAVRIGWNDGHDPKDLLEQDLFAALIPGPGGETFLELQTARSGRRPTRSSSGRRTSGSSPCGWRRHSPRSSAAGR